MATMTHAPASCPICGKSKDPAYRPFCSKRCADVDLSRWLKGSYAIPAVEVDDPDAELDDPDSSRSEF
jgi:endogenous inhibitor of DNA gyrase (YacG/DUF329 family)